MLETMAVSGQSWEAVGFPMLGSSVRSSNAYKDSRGASLGNSPSRNSPGQTVVDVGGERSTVA